VAGAPQSGFFAAGPRPSHSPSRKNAITASNHQGQVCLRLVSLSVAASATAGLGVEGVGAAGVGAAGVRGGADFWLVSRTAPQAVQKRVSALTRAPQFVQNGVMVMLCSPVACPEEPAVALKPAIYWHALPGGIRMRFWFSQLIKQ